MANKILKKYIYLGLFFLTNYVFSQNQKINMIILIDERICTSIYDFRISDPKTNVEIITGKYLPGDLIFDLKNYNELKKYDVIDYKISFDAILNIDKDIVSKRSFNLEIPKFFLYKDYIIVNIFNLNKKVYKKKYSKLAKNKEYYVIVETPDAMKFD
ncbi:MAG: hypothetical protein K0R36_1968 [Chryseobacterium sp.]|jgi:hypothetical protein|nr:hypothetical protein [Chryseobacterium sp.]